MVQRRSGADTRIPEHCGVTRLANDGCHGGNDGTRDFASPRLEAHLNVLSIEERAGGSCSAVTKETNRYCVARAESERDLASV